MTPARRDDRGRRLPGSTGPVVHAVDWTRSTDSGRGRLTARTVARSPEDAVRIAFELLRDPRAADHHLLEVHARTDRCRFIQRTRLEVVLGEGDAPSAEPLRALIAMPARLRDERPIGHHIRGFDIAGGDGTCAALVRVRPDRRRGDEPR